MKMRTLKKSQVNLLLPLSQRRQKSLLQPSKQVTKEKLNYVEMSLRNVHLRNFDNVVK